MHSARGKALTNRHSVNEKSKFYFACESFTVEML